jgi:hypothetical protein
VFEIKSAQLQQAEERDGELRRDDQQPQHEPGADDTTIAPVDPPLPTCAVPQRYCGRAGRTATIGVCDPEETFDRSLLDDLVDAEDQGGTKCKLCSFEA